jgi:flagellar biosynthesis GTPase FlhF
MKQKVHKIQAESLEAAMNKVKNSFGPDVLILDVEEKKEKKADSLGVSNIFEIRVAEAEGTATSLTERRSEVASAKKERDTAIYEEDAGTYRLDSGYRKFSEELGRIDTIIDKVEEIKNKLTDVIQPSVDYPLAEILSEAGASYKSIEKLAKSFEEHSSQDKGGRFREAVKDLRRYLSVSNSRSWHDISGAHLFFGSGGCGKTSLVVKLAGILVEEGKRVAIHTLFPRHNGEVERLKMVGEALGAQFKPLFDIKELNRLQEKAGKGDVILVDTPCLLTDSYLKDSEIRQFISEWEYIYKHFVFDLNASNLRLEEELKLYNQLSFDYAVLTKFDFTWDKGKIIDLVTSNPVMFSFINQFNHFGKGLDMATVRGLMMNISPRLITDGEGVEDILVNNDNVSVEDNNRKSESEPFITATEGVFK